MKDSATTEASFTMPTYSLVPRGEIHQWNLTCGNANDKYLKTVHCIYFGNTTCDLNTGHLSSLDTTGWCQVNCECTLMPDLLLANSTMSPIVTATAIPTMTTLIKSSTTSMAPAATETTASHWQLDCYMYETTQSCKSKQVGCDSNGYVYNSNADGCNICRCFPPHGNTPLQDALFCQTEDVTMRCHGLDMSCDRGMLRGPDTGCQRQCKCI